MAGLRRKAVVKTLPTQRRKVGTQAKLAGFWHWHVCIDLDCRTVYHCTCTDPSVNARCLTCEKGEYTEFMRWREPIACCFGNCDLLPASSDWWDWLKLAGPGPYYQCRTCKRCHGWPLA